MPIAQTRLEILQVHKFLQCIRTKDKPQIEKLCSHGVPHLINYSEPNDGETGLHLAARANDEDMVSFLLELGAHPNVVDLKGRTAAMRAAEFGHVQTLEVLSAAGSDMKIKDAEGKGILFYCILPTSRHAKCTQIVLQCGAECNNVANDGMPLLVLACEDSVENEKICIQFLENGADANSAHPTTCKTPLIEAARSGSVGVVQEILARGGAVNAVDKYKRTAAHMAAKNGHFDVLRLLCSYGADLSLADTNGDTMIHYTADGGFANCLKYLSQRGCRANTKNDDGLLPKMIAKNKGFKDVMKECRKAERLSKKLQGGGKAPADPWAVKMYDWSYANQAKLLDRFQSLDAEDNEVLSRDDFFDILVTLEAPINEESFKEMFLLHDKTKEGVINYQDFLSGKKYVHKTYLMSAFEKKEKKKKGGKKGKKKKGKTKVPMPICVGVDGARTECGEPPEHLIHRHVPFTDTGRFDRDHPPDHPIQDDSAWYLHCPEKTYINITDAAKITDLDSLRQAYAHGRSVNTQNKYYKTALMAACAHGNMEMAKFLLENGANINCQDNFKWTPLHHACLSGQLDIVKLLVARHADINAQAMNGGTPLMRAIQASAPDIVKFLIDKGCNVTLENRKGDNALDVAKWWADPRVLEIVQTKFESMPQPKDGKKGKGKKGRAKSGQKKAPPRAHSVPPVPQGGMTTQTMADSPLLSPHDRKGSVLRAASAMAGGIELHEDITYIPLAAWSNIPNTRELIVKKEQRRMRFGYGVDFLDFNMPFKENFMTKSKALGGVDSDDDDDD